MNSGSRFQKQYYLCLPSAQSLSHEEVVYLCSGVSGYDFNEKEYHFTAHSYGLDPDINADAVDFLKDVSDIIPADEEKRKRRMILDELSAYIENTYKEIKEHGLYYYLVNDKNLLFNYKKGIYQTEQTLSTETAFRMIFDYHGNMNQTINRLLDEAELLDHPLEELKHKLDVIIERRFKMADAQIPPSGEYTIVLKSDPASIFIHEVVGHFFEEDNFQQQSCFSPETVINPHIRVTDYAHTALGKPCPVPVHIDSEGTEAKDALLIQGGRVCGRMNNRQYAGEGVCTGNGRSEFFSTAPLIRMRNTALEVDKSLTMDLSSLEDALVVEKIEQGCTDLKGKAELFVESGYKLKKGKVIKDLRNFMLYGQAVDLLNSIVGCDDDFSWHSSSCGKNGYSLHLTHGSPSILLRGSIHGI
jgi:TldD protein